MLALEVASREVCKITEGFLLPGLVQMTDDSIDDTVYTSWVLETAHGSGSASYLSECPLYGIGSAHLLPVILGAGEEG